MKNDTALKILWDSCIHNEETKEAYEVLKNDTRPQAEWKRIIEEDNDRECSVCGFQEDGMSWNFCPQCGARMGGSEK